MERILRGDLRFSCAGFTYSRIASRLWVSAPSETSAHTGRRTSLRGLFWVPAMGLPDKLFSAIRAPSAGRQPICLPRERQHPLLSKLVAFRIRISRARLRLFLREKFFLLTFLYHLLYLTL